MKTSSLKQGDRVVIGKREDVRRGVRGTVCLVVDRGNFRETWGPCGKQILPSPMSDTRVVVAVPVLARRESEPLEWRAELKHHSSLYSYEEYRLAEGERKKWERDGERWKVAMRQASKPRVKALNRVTELLGTDVWWTSRRKIDGDRRWVDLNACSFDAVVTALVDFPEEKRQALADAARALKMIEAELAAWKVVNPDPRICRIPS